MFDSGMAEATQYATIPVESDYMVQQSYMILVKNILASR